MHKKISNSDWNMFKKIFEFLFPPQENKLSGKLFVSGEGYLEFVFHHLPKDVSVVFDDECDPNPCDPGQNDELDWNVVKHKHHDILVIKWKVSSMRTIKWQVGSMRVICYPEFSEKKNLLLGKK